MVYTYHDTYLCYNIKYLLIKVDSWVVNYGTSLILRPISGFSVCNIEKLAMGLWMRYTSVTKRCNLYQNRPNYLYTLSQQCYHL